MAGPLGLGEATDLVSLPTSSGIRGTYLSLGVIELWCMYLSLLSLDSSYLRCIEGGGQIPYWQNSEYLPR